MKEVIRSVTLLGLEELVLELGGDFRALAAEVGLNPAELKRPESLLPIRQTHDLANLAAERLKRKDLGLLWGARSDPSRLGPLYVALMNAQTARQAIKILAGFLHINFPTGSVFLKKLPGKRELLSVHSQLVRPPPLIQFYERRIGSLNVILKLVCGPYYRPKEIWFSHSQNAPAAAYLRAFGIRPFFDMPDNGIVISQNFLDAERPVANQQVREMALAYLKTHAAPAGASIRAETLHMVSVLMRSGNPTISDTARLLRMHPRTFQRRLKSEGASFESIRDDVRRSMAETLLGEPNTALIEVSLALHYANMSAFSRSCRRWFGMSPVEVRRRLQRKRRRVTMRGHLRRGRLRL